MKKIGIYILLLVISFSCVGTKKTEKVKTILSEENVLNSKYLLSEAIKNKCLGNIKEAVDLLIKIIQINPDSDVAYYELANIAAYSKDYDASVKFINKAIDIEPYNEWYYYLQGQVYLYKQNIDSSIIAFEKLVIICPKKIDYVYNLASLYKEKKDYKKSLLYLDKILEKNNTEELIIEKFRLLVNLKEYKKAIKLVEKQIEKNPADIRYPGILAELYSDLRKNEKAEELYKRIFEKDSLNTTAWISYSEFKRKSNPTESFYMLRKAFKNPKLSETDKIGFISNLFNNEEIYKKEKRNIGLLIEDVRSAHPQSFEIQAVYADYLIREKKEKETLHQLRLLYRLDKSNYIVGERLLFYENQFGIQDSVKNIADIMIKEFEKEPLPYLFSGVTSLMKKDYNSAIEVLKKGENYLNDNKELRIQVFSYLGEAYHNVKDKINSDIYFEKVLAIDPENIQVLNNYAYYLSIREEKLDQALNMSKKTVLAEPKNPTYLDTYAWILFKKGSYNEALVYIEKAFANSTSTSYDLNDHYGDILEKNGKEKEAVEYWKKAIELGGNNEEISKKINRINLPK